jgi:hypothetical protein
MKTLFAGAVIAAALVTSVVLPKEHLTPGPGCYHSSTSLPFGHIDREACK